VKIALLTLDFPPGVGGVQKYLYEIGRRLGQEHQLTFVTPVRGPLPEGLSFEKLYLPNDHLWSFMRVLRSLRPERILVGHAHPRLLIPAALTACGQYATITYGNDYLAAQHRWHRPLFNWLLDHSSPLITITRANAVRLHRLGIHCSAIIPPGTDPARFTPSLQPVSFPPVLLTVGRLVPRKGIDTVLHALPMLLEEFPDLRYRVVGDGPDRARLEQIAYNLGVTHAVEFMGHVSDQVLPEVYRMAHIFVMSAREEQETASIEGFGIVYLEAAASGLPVVAGRSGGAVEAVQEGKTGFLVPPDDPEALTQVLRRLLSDPALRRRMGQTGRRWVEEEMNWDRAVIEILKALETYR
jgi:phosphatidylinositol alpha-1,6-mannosyltransferase